MEVLISASSSDFNFDSTCSSPYISAPSSPKRFGSNFYFSAPTSPSRASAFYHEFNNLSFINRSISPSKSNDTQTDQNDQNDENDEEDFAFDFSGQLGRTSLSADELFDGGKIRPLQIDEVGNRKKKSLVSFSSPWSPGKKTLSPKSPKRNSIEQERGRGRDSAFPSSSRRKGTRSLSPYRDSAAASAEFGWEEQTHITKPNPSNSKPSSKKWRLKDFLLFRSASEGRETSKDNPFRRYTTLSKKNDTINEGSVSGSVSGSRRRGPVSAHELHYRSNRAVTEEMKRKTFLPYKQGLFGWLGFTPTAYGPSRGFTRG